MKDAFIANNDWLIKFMSCNNLSLRSKTAIAQKDPFPLTSNLVGCVMDVRRLAMKGNYPKNCVIAMDKAAAWLGMAGNTTVSPTGAKDIPLKSTGNETVRVSPCLTA